jgi:hypothetical protein
MVCTRTLALAIASLALAACTYQPQRAVTCPCAAVVSETEITSAKVPTSGNDPYGPAGEGYGSSLGPSGEPFQGNLYEGTHHGNRENAGTILKDSLSQ